MQNKPKPDPIRSGAKVIEATSAQWKMPVPARPYRLELLPLRQSDAGGQFVRDEHGRNVAYVAGWK